MNDQVKPPERIWIDKFTLKRGNGYYYFTPQEPSESVVEYVRAQPDEAAHYETFKAGWDAGFQEAQEPDRFPWQNRCEVRYGELFPAASPAVAAPDELSAARRAAFDEAIEIAGSVLSESSATGHELRIDVRRALEAMRDWKGKQG